MYRTENWKELIAKIAGEIRVSDNRYSWLLRAARNAKITHGQASDLFYGRKKDPAWSLGNMVRDAADKIDATEKAKTDAIEKARREAAHLNNKYQQIVRGSINVDQHLLGKTAFEVLDTSRLLGGLDLPTDYTIDIKPKGNTS